MYLVRRRAPAFAPQGPVRLRAAHPLTDGLVGAFVAGADGNMADLTGYAQPLTDTSSGDVTPGQITSLNAAASAFSGDSTNDRVDLGSISSSHPLSLSGKTTHSILAWLRCDNLSSGGGFPRIIDKSNGGFATNGWALYLGGSSGDGRAIINHGTSTGHSSNAAVVTAGVDTLVGYSMTSLANGQFYVDGEAVATTSATLPAFPTTTTNAAIGNWNHTTGRMFGGAIYCVLVYDRALTADDHLMAFDPASRFDWLEDPRERVLRMATPTVGGGSIVPLLMSQYRRRRAA